MSQQQLSTLHHFSLKDREETFNSTLRYFGENKELRRNNLNYANRLKFVAAEHCRTGKSFNLLIQQALGKWPLGVFTRPA